MSARRKRPTRQRPRRDSVEATGARATSQTTAPPPAAHLDRRDLTVAAALALAAAFLFLSTFSAHVGLGDASESVSGVKALGVLHAPGYPSYVIAAHAFARVFAFGDWALRVNMFSAVCAALMVGASYLLARCFDAGVLGATIGSLAIATSASFWFNAGFAKHYAFSGLLVTVAAVAVLRWQATGRRSWLFGGSALIGICLGASWELAVIMAVGLMLLVRFGPRRVSLGLAAGALCLAAAVAGACYVFLVVRARAHPGVNWGEVTGARRLLDQVSQRDFRSSDVVAPGAGAGAAVLPLRFLSDVAILVRDVGLGATLLALVGIGFAARRLDRGKQLFLGTVCVLNLLAVALVTGLADIHGFLTGLVGGGYLLDALIVLAVLVALGTAPTVEFLCTISRVLKPVRSRGRTGTTSRRHGQWIATAVVIAVLLPSLLVHFRHADHRGPPLADRYAKRVLGELPRRAVFFVYQADLSFPLVDRQTVYGERRDVTFIIATSLQFSWYREQVTRSLGLASPLRSRPYDQQTIALVKALRMHRPVYLDTEMTALFRERLGYRTSGLVSEVVAGIGPKPPSDLQALAARLLSADRRDGFAGHAELRFPNVYVHYLYERAHIELAKLFAGAHDLEAARTELQHGLDVFPDDVTTRLVLRYAGQQGEKPNDVTRVIQAL